MALNESNLMNEIRTLLVSTPADPDRNREGSLRAHMDEAVSTFGNPEDPEYAERVRSTMIEAFADAIAYSVAHAVVSELRNTSVVIPSGVPVADESGTVIGRTSEPASGSIE